MKKEPFKVLLAFSGQQIGGELKQQFERLPGTLPEPVVAYAGSLKEAAELVVGEAHTGSPFSALFIDVELIPDIDSASYLNDLCENDSGIQLVVVAGLENPSDDWSHVAGLLERNESVRFLRCPFMDHEVVQLVRHILYTRRLILNLADSELSPHFDPATLFENIVDTAQFIILLLGTNGEIRYFNPYMEELTGYTLDEVRGKDWFETFLPPQDYDAIRSLFKSAISDVRTRGNINPIVGKDGRTILVKWYDITYRNAAGEVEGLLSTGQDVTEEQRISRELKNSQQLLSSVVENAPTTIFMKSVPELRYELMNKAGEELIGMKASELLGKNDFDLFPEEIASEFVRKDREVLDKCEVVETPEEWFHTADGSIKWVRTFKTCLYDEQGEVAHLMGISMDITRRKEVELQLLKSKKDLAEAQKVAQLGNIELELPTGKETVSDEVYEIFGIDKDRSGSVIQVMEELIHPEDREMVQRAHQQALKTRSDYEVIYRLMQADGRVLHIQERGRNYFDDSGKVTRSVRTIQDITRMYEMEEQLRQAQKMEAIGTLVGGIAHDFNNKLAAITGNLYLAQMETSGNPHATEHLDKVATLSFEAASMVEQLLTFARKGKVAMMPLTLSSFIKEASKLHRVAIPENIHFSIQYGSDPLPVMGNITQLQQVFLNLVNNARDALEHTEQPKIEVALSGYQPDEAFYARHPELEHSEAFACLKVTDNGDGIAEENIDQVFDPFFTTKEVGKGTGLGLATTYGVVMAHKGAIEVESQPGEGTSITVFLPIHDQADGDFVDEDGAEVIDGKGETILIADDDENVLESLQGVLESMNYRVLAANDGLKAVEMFEQHQDEIDLVILDMVMPRMKGVEVARKIRSISPEIKLFFATGYDSHQREVKASGEVGEVLEKPYHFDQVSRKIRDTLNER